MRNEEAIRRREEIAALLSAGLRDDARASALEWAEGDPPNIADRIQLASALLSVGEQGKAATIAGSLPGDVHLPSNLRALVMYERIRAYRAPDFEAARAEAEAMTRRFPFVVPGWDALGRASYWMGDLERARFAFMRARFLSSDERFQAYCDRFLRRIEVRQAEKLAQRDRVLELCDSAEGEGFAGDGWFGRKRALALWRLGRFGESLEALDRARDLALATGSREWDASGDDWGRGDALIRAVILVDLDSPAEAEQLALEACGETPTEFGLFALAYVRAKARLPGASEAIMAFVSASDDQDDPDMILDLPSSDGRPWREVLGIAD